MRDNCEVRKSARTSGPYDRRDGQVSLDEVEQIVICCLPLQGYILNPPALSLTISAAAAEGR